MVRPKKTIESLFRVENSESTRLDMLRLDKNENIIGLEKEFVDLVKAKISSDFITTYPECFAIYKRIAKSLGVSQDMVYVTAGSDAAIKAAFEVFVSEGHEVVFPHPTYAMYYVYCEMFGGVARKIGYENDFSLSVKKIKDAINAKTALICIANPNSPTGTIIERKELIDLISYAKEKGVVVLVDEAYYPYYPHSIIDEVKNFDNLIVTRTFSKAYGLASARLGFAVSDAKMTNLLKRVRPLYEVNSYAVMVGSLALDHPEVLARNLEMFEKGKRVLLAGLDKLGLKYYAGHANFVSIHMGSPERAVRAGQELYKQGVLVKSGFKDSPLQDCLRVSVGTPEQMTLFMQKFEKTLEAEPQKHS